jgi:hypothetical protein
VVSLTISILLGNQPESHASGHCTNGRIERRLRLAVVVQAPDRGMQAHVRRVGLGDPDAAHRFAARDAEAVADAAAYLRSAFPRRLAA